MIYVDSRNFHFFITTVYLFLCQGEDLDEDEGTKAKEEDSFFCSTNSTHVRGRENREELTRGGETSAKINIRRSFSKNVHFDLISFVCPTRFNEDDDDDDDDDDANQRWRCKR
ncbi:hypothetical protein RUM44_012752 [Polyplax serrata]|uniref:Uncharacterized protein n=1 Tax=Polyplax serrata TaxID=468196 RepID=A0ABR1BC72_POLSC